MNPDELYREENYTDQKLGNIRKLIPVTADGSPDSNRSVLFVGSAQVMSPMGTIPLSFELSGTTLGEAAADFAEKAQKAVEEASAELERVRREHASQIVVPGQGGGGGGGIIT